MTSTPDTVVRSLPHFLVRGQGNAVTLKMQRADAVVLPSEVLVSVWSPSGSLASPDIVNEQSASALADGSGYTYTIAAASLPATLSLSERWVVRWTVTVGGVVDYVQEAAHLCRSMIRPVVTVSEVEGFYTPIGYEVDSLTGAGNVQTHLDGAWVDIVRRLMSQGRLPWRILDPHSLGEAHRERALERIARAYYGNVNGDQWLDIANTHRAAYEKAMASLVVTYDSDDDGSPALEETGTGGSPILMTGGGPRYPRGPLRWGR